MRAVVGGGTQFAPCVCLKPLHVPTGSAGIQPGAYLLVIEPHVGPEREAKVYGEVCASPKTIRCEAEGWRCGYLLSLVRFLAPVPIEPTDDEWALRGLLSAYYFDEFEHNLNDRWRPDFAENKDFCGGVAPCQEMCSAVPLGMVYLTDGGIMLFLDPWIPRRLLISTRAAGWSANLLGAPTPAAAVARSHQFQCHLAESLDSEKFQAVTVENLYQRGFRHIPPVGFLPLVETDQDGGVQEECADLGIASKIPDTESLQGYSKMIAEAEKRTCRYFEGTNIIPFYTVALADDDILEDVRRAYEKDPIIVQKADGLSKDWKNWLVELAMALKWRETTATRDSGLNFEFPSAPLDEEDRPNLLRIAKAIWNRLDPAVASIASRELAIVKIIIPLEGASRWSPFTAPQAAATKTTAKPRPFVLYVKQRIVLLDAVFVFLEALKSSAEESDDTTAYKLLLNFLRSGTEAVQDIFANLFLIPWFQVWYINALVKDDPELKKDGQFIALLSEFVQIEKVLGNAALKLTDDLVAGLEERFGELPVYKYLSPLFKLLNAGQLNTMTKRMLEALTRSSG